MIKGSAAGNQNPGEESLSVKELLKKYPDIIKVLTDFGVTVKSREKMSLSYLCNESGVDYLDVFEILLSEEKEKKVEHIDIKSLTIVPGNNKSGKKEFNHDILISKGETIALVGATGSGKSLLLGDIESFAQGDSPSGRRILVNGIVLNEEKRVFEIYKPIAQISQNMNYILDMTVGEFLDFHIESRGVKGVSRKEVIAAACELCGESFDSNVHLASLSGGQTRSLMIADAVYISKSPVILVDEIENAGIDKIKAINFLIKSSTITLIATHEPLIALMADKRIILKNGGIEQVICTSVKEKKTVEQLMEIESGQNKLKIQLRLGGELIL